MTRLAKTLAAITVVLVSFGVAGGAITVRANVVPDPVEIKPPEEGAPVSPWVRKCIVQGDPESNQIALTFDDGPDPVTTPAILDLLKKHNAKATFFVIGRRVKEHPELLRRIHDEGHEIGNHSNNHRNLLLLDRDEVYREYRDCNAAVKSVLGFDPAICRPPGGNANPSVIEVGGELNMATVFWTCNTFDFEAYDTELIKNRVLRVVRPGGIVLMHDKVAETVTALDEVLRSLRGAGYDMVTVSQLTSHAGERDDSMMLPYQWRRGGRAKQMPLSEIF
jgi:peptidoglycan/xylan/chitin deacetylase (PgdA/CDA1 family)